MAEYIDRQKLIDDFRTEGAYFVYGDHVPGIVSRVGAQPTIDPETLPIVRQLREELARVTAERDALLNQGIWTTSKYDGNTLTFYRHDRKNLNESRNVVMIRYTGTTVSVGYSETGKSGPYKLVMNVDEFGVLTMANEVARALFGHTESNEARP